MGGNPLVGSGSWLNVNVNLTGPEMGDVDSLKITVSRYLVSLVTESVSMESLLITDDLCEAARSHNTVGSRLEVSHVIVSGRGPRECLYPIKVIRTMVPATIAEFGIAEPVTTAEKVPLVDLKSSTPFSPPMILNPPGLRKCPSLTAPVSLGCAASETRPNNPTPKGSETDRGMNCACNTSDCLLANFDTLMATSSNIS
jgi:hypothetical protein